jgi:uncharacterized membrane protein YgaE (UPF0421/DUF939 family)
MEKLKNDNDLENKLKEMADVEEQIKLINKYPRHYFGEKEIVKEYLKMLEKKHLGLMAGMV